MMKEFYSDRGKYNSLAPCGDKNIFNLLTFHCKNLAKLCHSEVQISEIPRLPLFDTEICTVESPIAQSMKSYVLGRYAQPTLCHPELVSGSKKQMLKRVQHDKNKKAAFTLAEILITIGVIGVVSAMTIPTLMTKIQEKTTYNKLKATYAILNQAHKLAVVENGSAEGWDIGTRDTADGAKKLYEIYKPHLKLARECGTSHGCFYEGRYKALFNDNFPYQPNSSSLYARGQLLNGTSLAFWSHGSGCPDDWCGNILVDINGIDAPNRAGVDYFIFNIGKENLSLPSKRSLYGTDCKYADTSNINGTYCSGWILRHGNMDYLRKPIPENW